MLLAQTTTMTSTVSTDWITFANMVAAVAAMSISAVAAYLSYLVLRIQIEPTVVLYIQDDLDRPSILNLVLANIGKGMARNIKCTFSDWIPARAFGFENAPMPEKMSTGPLFMTIPALGPNEKRVITWGQYGGLKKGMGGRTITCTITYETDPLGPIHSKTLTSTHPIEIDSFAETDASDRNFVRQIAKELESLTKVLEHSASGFRPLKIHLEDPLKNRAPHIDATVLSHLKQVASQKEPRDSSQSPPDNNPDSSVNSSNKA